MNKRFVMELRNVDNLFRSSHGGSLLGANIYSTAPAKYRTSQGRRRSWQHYHSVVDDSRTAHLRPYSRGATPVSRLKTRLKELSDPYPTATAPSENEIWLQRIRSPALYIRHYLMYCS